MHRRAIPVGVLLALALLPGAVAARPRGTAPPAAARVEAILAALDRAATADLWPGYDPRATPILLFDGESTWLVRHPSPPTGFPGGFVAVKGAKGLFMMPGRHPEVKANTSVTFAGVPTATVIADGAASSDDVARLAVHEIFHVFERARHPDWIANEADLFTYPVDDARALAGRRLEWVALRRALDASDEAGAACWAGAAVTARRERFARLGKAAAAYERGSELNEGLATYVEERAARSLGGPAWQPPPLDAEEFPADQFRARTYRSGAALGRLLDRFAPGWRERLEAGPTHPLDAILGDALAARAPATEPAPPCTFTDAETAAAAARARDDVARVASSRDERLRAFLDEPGYVILIEPAEGTLNVKGFDPLNATALGGGQVLHSRFLEITTPFGDGTILGRPSLTLGTGAEPLFAGLRRITLTGLAVAPTVKHGADGVAIVAEGVSLRFARASVRDDGTTLFVKVGAPGADTDTDPVRGVPPGAAGTSLTEVGDPLPEFTLTGLDGAPLSSSTFRGRAGVLMFWATWCPACRAELPRVEMDLWRRFESPELAFVAAARGQNAGEVQPFREQNRYTMPMALDPDRSAFAKFATQDIPRLYVVSPDGSILFQMVGFDEEGFAEAQAILERELTALRTRNGGGGR